VLGRERGRGGVGGEWRAGHRPTSVRLGCGGNIGGGGGGGGDEILGDRTGIGWEGDSSSFTMSNASWHLVCRSDEARLSLGRKGPLRDEQRAGSTP